MDPERIAYWNARHARRAAKSPHRGPRWLLRAFRHLLPASGQALDVAAGLGQNGLFLARQGLSVLALDIAETGLRQAQQVARAEFLAFQAVVYDVERLELPSGSFDVIVNMLFLERCLLPVYKRALKPGGLLFFETFVRQGAASDSHYLRPGELEESFAGFQIEYAGTGRQWKREGMEEMRTTRLIARKPSGLTQERSGG